MTKPNQNPELDSVDKINKNGGAAITLTQEEYDKLIAEKASLAQDKANLVGEIKGLREKNYLTEQEKSELSEKLKKLSDMGGNVDITKPDAVREVAGRVVQEILDKQKVESREKAKALAWEKFVKDNPEFSSQNDEAGLKKSLLDKKLARFNLSSCESEEDFFNTFSDAQRLLYGTSKINEEDYDVEIPPSPSPKSPKKIDVSTLTSKELKLVQRFMGGDKEKYLKEKAKRPDYIANLLSYIRE